MSTNIPQELFDDLGTFVGRVLGSGILQNETADEARRLWNEWRAFGIAQRGPDGFCHGQRPHCGKHACPHCRSMFE